jgi:hypothetical protein
MGINLTIFKTASMRFLLKVEFHFSGTTDSASLMGGC